MSMSCLLVYVSDEYEWYRTTFNTVLVMSMDLDMKTLCFCFVRHER